MNGFDKEDSLNDHLEYCGNNEAVRTTFAKEKFTHVKNHYKHMRVPFAVYADFECFTEKLDSVRPSEDAQYTMKYQKHEPSGFCLYVVSPYFEFEQIMYTKKSEDEDIGRIFFETLETEVRKVRDLIKHEEMIFTDDDKRTYEESTHCHICGKEFSQTDRKVRDHCHISGKFRGTAHNKCNLKFRVPKFTPVFFHNLSGYDAHLFVKNLGVTEGDIRCIPNNKKKYINFSKNIVVGERVNKVPR